MIKNEVTQFFFRKKKQFYFSSLSLLGTTLLVQWPSYFYKPFIKSFCKALQNSWRHSFSPDSSKISSRHANFLSFGNKESCMESSSKNVVIADRFESQIMQIFHFNGRPVGLRIVVKEDNLLRCKLGCFSLNSHLKWSNISELSALVIFLPI